MSRTVSITAEVDVDLGDVIEDLDDEDIVAEVRRRGLQKELGDETQLEDAAERDTDMQNALDYWRRGSRADALVWLERALPEFAGLSNLLDPT